MMSVVAPAGELKTAREIAMAVATASGKNLDVSLTIKPPLKPAFF
jgi:hypothetical protein